MITLSRTGKKIPFKDVSTGSVFYAYDDYWTRTDYEAATVLTGSGGRGSACYFCITPKADDEKPEVVEIVTVSTEAINKTKGN